MTWDVGLISRVSSWLSLSMYVRIASSWARILSISSSARPSRASLATCSTSRRVIFIAASSTEGIEMIAFYYDPAKIFRCLLLVPTLTASAAPSLRAPLVADPERLGPGPAPLASRRDPSCFLRQDLQGPGDIAGSGGGALAARVPGRGPASWAREGEGGAPPRGRARTGAGGGAGGGGVSGCCPRRRMFSRAD